MLSDKEKEIKKSEIAGVHIARVSRKLAEYEATGNASPITVKRKQGVIARHKEMAGEMPEKKEKRLPVVEKQVILEPILEPIPEPIPEPDIVPMLQAVESEPMTIDMLSQMKIVNDPELDARTKKRSWIQKAADWITDVFMKNE